MTQMETPYSHGKPSPLAARDALLSRLGGVEWPFGVLLGLVPLGSEEGVLDVGAGDGRLLEAARARGHRGASSASTPARPLTRR